MTQLEIEAIKALQEFWQIWVGREKDTRARIKAMVHDSYKGFGTNADEYMSNKVELMAQLDKEMEQIPDGYQLDVNWIQSSQIDGTTVAVCAELHVEAELMKKTVVFEGLRATTVLKKFGDELLQVQSHISAPDAGAASETVPGVLEPKRHEEVSVLFSDFVSFTNIVATIPARTLVAELNDLYQYFDDIMEAHCMEKIQITGDGYLAVSGLSDGTTDHAVACVTAGKRIIEYLAARNESSAVKWHARIGIHSGPVTAGVIGKKKFSFNIFGDTVNIASRFETSSETDRINVSAHTYSLIKETFDCTYRGKVEIKGKGEVDMYFVD